jgi:hypothetical protein
MCSLSLLPLSLPSPLLPPTFTHRRPETERVILANVDRKRMSKDRRRWRKVLQDERKLRQMLVNKNLNDLHNNFCSRALSAPLSYLYLLLLLLLLSRFIECGRIYIGMDGCWREMNVRRINKRGVDRMERRVREKRTGDREAKSILLYSVCYIM